VDKERVLKVLPLGRRKIEVRQGGLSGKTLFQPELGDKTDEMVVANAIITVMYLFDRQLWNCKRADCDETVAVLPPVAG
jgi:hypothetical protein